MNKDFKFWEYSIEICYSHWTDDRIGHLEAKRFFKKCIDEEEQKRAIIEFQKNHDVLIWWIHSWKTRKSISEWFKD